MRVTKLDSFNEGFRVAPRRKHTAPKNGIKQLSRAELSLNCMAAIRGRLETVGIVHLEIFGNQKTAGHHIRALVRENPDCLRIVRDGQKVVACELIKGKKLKPVELPLIQLLENKLDADGIILMSDYKHKKPIMNAVGLLKMRGFTLTTNRAGGNIISYTLNE